MRILIATPVFYPMINGVAMFSYNLATGLARRGNEVLVITPSQTGKRHTKTLNGVKVCYLDSIRVGVYPDQIHDVPKKKQFFYKNSLRASVFPAKQIKKIFDDFKPEVVHVQGSDPIGVATIKRARKNRVPVVTTEHNQPEVLTESLMMPGVLRKPTNKALAKYFVRRQKKSDYVTMPTKLSIDKLIGSKDLGVPVVAVSNGVDLSSFTPGEAADELYIKYNIPRKVPIILYIGRLDPEKNVGVVLAAFADFLDKHKLDRLSKTLFLVAGDGVDKNHLISETKRLGINDSVKFLGRVMPPDLYGIYKMGDVFVTASEIETQGIVLIEAAASGLPLIAVDAGAVAEVCRDGVNGYLLKPGDMQAISAAMADILTDDNKRSKMVEASIKIASEHSLEKTLDKFLEIYKKVCYNS